MQQFTKTYLGYLCGQLDLSFIAVKNLNSYEMLSQKNGEEKGVHMSGGNIYVAKYLMGDIMRTGANQS